MENIDSQKMGSKQTEQAETRPTTRTFVREVTATYRGPRRSTAPITQPKAAAAFIRKVLPDNSREHVIVIYLDGGSKICAYSVVATGTANHCQIHAREVFQMAVLVGAVSIIIGHNHPSDSATPSESDRNMTTQIRDAGVLLGIKLLDHVIVSETQFYSFSESGPGNRKSLVG